MQKISITDEESHRQVESSQTHYCLMWAPHTSLTIHTHIFTYGQSHACEQPHPVSGVYFYTCVFVCSLNVYLTQSGSSAGDLY